MDRLKQYLQCNYISEVINTHQSDSSKLWKRLKEFWRNKTKNTTIQSIHGQTKDLGIANELNKFFAWVGENLASKFDNDGIQSLPRRPPTFEFTNTDYDTVQKLINNLNVQQPDSLRMLVIPLFSH